MEIAQSMEAVVVETCLTLHRKSKKPREGEYTVSTPLAVSGVRPSLSVNKKQNERGRERVSESVRSFESFESFLKLRKQVPRLGSKHKPQTFSLSRLLPAYSALFSHSLPQKNRGFLMNTVLFHDTNGQWPHTIHSSLRVSGCNLVNTQLNGPLQRATVS